MKKTVNPGLVAPFFAASIILFFLALSSCANNQAMQDATASPNGTDSSGPTSGPKYSISCYNKDCVMSLASDTSGPTVGPKMYAEYITKAPIPANSKITVELVMDSASYYRAVSLHANNAKEKQVVPK
jgi:hypothetical protein